MSLETAGTIIDEIPVEISYRIIELFSAGLYSSPNKAFEELVCNSYDAFADQVAVYVPSDLSVEGEFIWVCDNGDSMDQEGLKQLWKIGDSNKRGIDIASKSRKQIGQFGIGKLSTYILANRLTYVCKKDDRYLAVTMRYDDISDTSTGMKLNEREISEEDAQSLLTEYVNIEGQSLVPFDLFGVNAERSWTLSVLSGLKPKAMDIREGRLKWVLRTALPLNPGFKLFYNGSELKSSKTSKPLQKSWVIGQDDSTAEKMELSSYEDEDGRWNIDFANLSGVSGEFELFEDSLVDGSKSSELGRSHGIFLIVRGRLVNLDDPLLGMSAFSHGAFNRTRITIFADGLDKHITSTRESIKDSAPFNQLKEYIKKKFNNEIKTFHFEEKRKQEQTKNIGYRLAQTSLTASKRPLLVFAKKFFAGKISNPFSILPPSTEIQDQLIDELTADLVGEENVIKKVEWKFNAPHGPIGQLNLETGELDINLAHPYIANYYDSFKDTLPLQYIAITEVLTEAHLYELDIDEEQIRSIMVRRDHTLRELSLSQRENAPTVALILKDSLADEVGLEEAAAKAFTSLGFETVPIGGNGKPDGIATANLGYANNGAKQTYSLTYDTKSTAKKSIQAGTTRLAILNKHKKDYNADFCVVIAPDFQGATNPDSTISQITEQQNVTAIRVTDLVRLLLLSAPKQLGLLKLKSMFETCHTPDEVKNWIDNLESEPTIAGPIKEILQEIYKLQKEDDEPITTQSLRHKVNSVTGKRFSTKDIEDTISSIEKLASGFIDFDGNIVGIQGSPEKVMNMLQNSLSDVPVGLRQTFLDALKN